MSLKFVTWSIVIMVILTQVKWSLHFILLFLDLENPNHSSTSVSKLKRLSKSVKGMFYIYLLRLISVLQGWFWYCGLSGLAFISIHVILGLRHPWEKWKSINLFIMAPNTRKRKNRLEDGLATYIKDLNLNENDEIEVIILSLKNIGLLDKLRFLKKTTKNGRKLTLLVTRQAIWDYWHKKVHLLRSLYDQQI